jgi:hypothetical protein
MHAFSLAHPGRLVGRELALSGSLPVDNAVIDR